MLDFSRGRFLILLQFFKRMKENWVWWHNIVTPSAMEVEGQEDHLEVKLILG